MLARALIMAGLCAALAAPSAAAAPPHLEARGGATQLIVDGRPFLIRGGELENSSASSTAFMATVWPKLTALNLNTVLAPVYWEAIEPAEGRFDVRSVDDLLAGARRHHMRLVLLWFGSWKNSMSSYVPAWVKRDPVRFPRAARTDGSAMEILSALSATDRDADADAFAALMTHLRRVDGARHTVLMVQVENEVGMIPEARDRAPAADAAFAAAVPAALTDYLAAHRATLQPELKAAWEAHGARTGAGWAETFGDGPQTDEFFTAWTEALYTERVAARGKAIYPLPMYVNAALIRPGRAPGQYPSGGPLPHLFDVWRAAAPDIDFLAPDLYFPNAIAWATRYAMPGNPLFIPESGRVSGTDLIANALYADTQLDAMGVAVYAPERLSPDDAKSVAEGFDLVRQLTPLLLASQGRAVGIRPPIAFDGTADLAPQTIAFGPYRFEVHFRVPAPISTGAAGETDIPGAHGGVIVPLGQDEFLVAGTGMILTFTAAGQGRRAGIESIWEGRFAGGNWVAGRNLNGDDSNQGRELRLPSGSFAIRRLRLYRY